MKKTRRIIRLIPLFIVLVIICCSCTTKNSNNETNSTYVMDLEEKARLIDKRKFVIDYDVKEPSPKSKEIIAVAFNTEREYNVGFIDEYGNVLTEPFIVDDSFNSSDIKRFYGELFEDERNEVFYDKSFKVVTPSNEQMNEHNELKENESYLPPSKRDTEIMKEIYKKLYTKEYNENANVAMNDKGFLLEFNDNEKIYSFIANRKGNVNLKLISQIKYLESGEIEEFQETLTFPKKGSIVGCALIEGYGQIYFNLNGDIIWITYENY